MIPSLKNGGIRSGDLEAFLRSPFKLDEMEQGRQGQGNREAQGDDQESRVRPIELRELSSLADGLNPMSGTFVAEPLNELLELAHERFPGEFWVHFRLAFFSQFTSGRPE